MYICSFFSCTHCFIQSWKMTSSNLNSTKCYPDTKYTKVCSITVTVTLYLYPVCTYIQKLKSYKCTSLQLYLWVPLEIIVKIHWCKCDEEPNQSSKTSPASMINISHIVHMYIVHVEKKLKRNSKLKIKDMI